MIVNKRYQPVAKFQSAAVLICIILGALSCGPAIADQANSERESIPQSIINLDLCTLAYQLYHQSLCLPLDPWFDVMSRIGSDRRNNICSLTHEYSAGLDKTSLYCGPNAVQGWDNTNKNLDPIITNFKQMDAKLPAFTRDGEHFLAVEAPDYVTQNIKFIDSMRYRGKPTGLPSTDCERVAIREYSSGTDHLITFEGGTGIVESSQPAWGPMGFVLMRKTPTGYDLHIVFRGSRSGASLSKTVWRAQDLLGEHKGNPDWITDLRSTTQISQPLISKSGKVTAGFAEALPTMLGSLSSSCKFLEQKYPVPEHIYVTGHSLGAGLATQFVSAILQGSFGDDLQNQVKSWPWKSAKLIAYAQPIPGNPEFAQNFDKLSSQSEHYWVSGDSVVEATSSRIVGLFIDKGEHCGIQNKLNSVANCNDNPHEVFVIRGALLRDLATTAAPISAQLGKENTWGYYDSVANMLEGKATSYVYPGAPPPIIVSETNLRKILQNYNFGAEFDRWLENVYSKMIADKSSYIGPKFQSTLDERRKVVLDVVARMRKAPSSDNAQELDALVNDFELVKDQLGLANEEQWIYCAMVLSRLQKTNLTLAEMMSKPEIKASLQSKFDEN